MGKKLTKQNNCDTNNHVVTNNVSCEDCRKILIEVHKALTGVLKQTSKIINK